MKIRNATKTLVSSVIAITVCFTMLIGTTFAWFTDSSASGINQIKSGNLDVGFVYTNSYNGTPEEVNEGTKIFADINGEEITWEPGASASGRFEVSNNGTLALKYQLSIIYANATKTPSGKTLADVLSIYAIARNKTTGTDGVMEDAVLEQQQIDSAVTAYDPMNMPYLKDGFALEAYLLPGESITYEVGICWNPSENDNEFNVEGGLSIDFAVSLRATQMTYENDGDGFVYDSSSEMPEAPVIPDTWDGTLDFSWADPTAPEVTISSAEAFMAFAKMLDQNVKDTDLGNAGSILTKDQLNNFFFDAENPRNVTLGADINLYSKDGNGETVCFEPIGSYRQEKAFSGTFDGKGHTIYNLYQNTWALDNGYYYGDLGLGLFGAVENATIKNLTIDGADISGESAICGTVAAVAGGECVFENITVKNARVADYQYYAGGIVGWASGKHVYKNCVIDESSTIAAQWGDFDNSIGGVIGGAAGSAEILLKDCVVACRIDAYNDVTSSYQWYAYRRAGMLIGNTGKTEDVDGRTVAAAPQLTCENVSVIYGDWANYTYCEFAGQSWPYVRVQAGVSNSAYSNPRYGNPKDANGNVVKDDNHVHNEGEDHFVLCVFDQLYGGGQGVYGQPCHEGVNVVYNNK